MSAAADQRTLWRELVNETDTTVIPDARVDLYLNEGAKAVNRLVGAYWLDTTLTLAANDGDMALPADFSEVVHVYHNGKELDKADLDRWKDDSVNWRTGRAGLPKEWAIIGAFLVLNCPPSSAAVAAAGSLDFRYVATPPLLVTDTAIAWLSTQDHSLITYRAVALWSSSYPDSALASGRAAYYDRLFEKETEKVALQYQARRLLR